MVQARFRLLDTSVRVESSSRALLDRITLCYPRMPRATSPGVDLEASVESDALEWAIRVDGRQAVRVADEASAVRAVNHELLHGLMLHRRELFYVHAGVVRVGDAAIVLPGLSRAGKSTLALALVQQGAQLVSDEVLAFDPRSGLVEPVLRAIKIRDACVEYFPALASRFVGTGECRFLPFDDARGVAAGRAASRARVRMVVAPSWQATASDDLIEISQGEAILELTKSALNFGTHREASIDHLVALVEHAVSYRLAWNEPNAAAAILLDALGRAT